MGTVIAAHDNTAMVAEAEYPSGDMAGRVAVFTRNSAGVWQRTGSIGSRTGTPFDGFGSTIAVFDDVALISSGQGMYVFHRSGSSWKQVQLLRLKTGWFFTGAALNHGYAFLATELNTQGVVYAYKITKKGRLSYLHALNSGVDFDSFGAHIALSGDHLLVSAATDESSQGAAYVFERRGDRWRKQQKLVNAATKGNDRFGEVLAISGNTIAISAPGFATAPSPDSQSRGNALRRLCSVIHPPI